MTGTPAWVSARRTGPRLLVADRTTTAIWDHGTPSSRWARRIVSATKAASIAGESKTCTSAEPGVDARTRHQPAVLPRSGQPLGDPAADRQQRRSGAAAHAEGEPVGGPPVAVPEPLGELGDAARFGAAERVDGLVGVADDHQVTPAAGQQLDQLHLGGVGVLVLVDEQPARPVALGAQQLRVGAQLVDGGAHQLGGVVAAGPAAGDRREVGDVLVLPEEVGGGHPVRETPLPPPRGEPAGVDAALGGPEQQVAQLVAEPRHRQRLGQLVGPADHALLVRVAAEQLATTASCSAEVSSRGAGSPRRTAARRSTPKA